MSKKSRKGQKPHLDLVTAHNLSFDALIRLIKNEPLERGVKRIDGYEKKRNFFDRLFLRSGDNCYWCGNKLNHKENDDGCKSLDHMIPRIFGGPNHIDNLVLACRGCDRSRGFRPDLDSILEYYGITMEDIEPYL